MAFQAFQWKTTQMYGAIFCREKAHSHNAGLPSEPQNTSLNTTHLLTRADAAAPAIPYQLI